MSPLANTMGARQSGSVMLISLIMLVVIGTLGLISIKTSKLESRMSGNEQVRIDAHQTAQALIDVVIADPALTPVVGDVGQLKCTPGAAGCDTQDLVMPAGAIATEVAASHLSGSVEYTEAGPPPRILNSSSESFTANHYSVNADYDRADEGLGRSNITQGLIILTPSL